MENNKNLVQELNKFLANLNMLYVKLHNYHWNIQGRGFFQLHETYEELYDKTAEALDEVAERILIIGARPAATMKEYLELATIEERKSEAIDTVASIKEIQADFEKMHADSLAMIELAEEANDPVTADIFTGYAASYHKTLWMIKAYLG